MASVSFFLIGSLLCGFAQSMGVVILGRTVQGIGGDGVWSKSASVAVWAQCSLRLFFDWSFSMLFS
jgi:MFS family permease